MAKFENARTANTLKDIAVILGQGHLTDMTIWAATIRKKIFPDTVEITPEKTQDAVEPGATVDQSQAA